MEAQPPLHQRFIDRLGFAFVFVETAAALASEHLPVAQPEQHGRSMIAASISPFEGRGNVDRHIDPDLIHQPQRTHWHSPLHKRIVDLVGRDPGLNQLRRIEQVGK